MGFSQVPVKGAVTLNSSYLNTLSSLSPESRVIERPAKDQHLFGLVLIPPSRAGGAVGGLCCWGQGWSPLPPIVVLFL